MLSGTGDFGSEPDVVISSAPKKVNRKLFTIGLGLFEAVVVSVS
jgi:hypothetical protein